MKKIVFLFYVSFILLACDSDASSDNEYSIIGNWVIEELTYNENHVNWGECGHLENMSFYEDYTFAWELYAVTDEFLNCVPIPPAEGTWEQINYNTVQLTDNDDDEIVFEVVYNETQLHMNFFIEPTTDEPEGIHIHFVFIKS